MLIDSLEMAYDLENTAVLLRGRGPIPDRPPSNDFAR